MLWQFLTHASTNRLKRVNRIYGILMFCAEYSILYQRDDGSMTSSIIILIISWSFKPQNCTHSAVPQQIVIQPHTWESISLGSIRVIQNLLNVNVKNCLIKIVYQSCHLTLTKISCTLTLWQKHVHWRMTCNLPFCSIYSLTNCKIKCFSTFYGKKVD